MLTLVISSPAKIYDLDQSLVHDHVLGLEVPMDDVDGVHVVHRLNHLLDDVCGLFLGSPPSLFKYFKNFTV